MYIEIWKKRDCQNQAGDDEFFRTGEPEQFCEALSEPVARIRKTDNDDSR